jgi:hypothetical protein
VAAAAAAKAEQVDMRDCYVATLELYVKVFGEAPNPSVWPRPAGVKSDASYPCKNNDAYPCKNNDAVYPCKNNDASYPCKNNDAVYPCKNNDTEITA